MTEIGRHVKAIKCRYTDIKDTLGAKAVFEARKKAAQLEARHFLQNPDMSRDLSSWRGGGTTGHTTKAD